MTARKRFRCRHVLDRFGMYCVKCSSCVLRNAGLHPITLFPPIVKRKRILKPGQAAVVKITHKIERGPSL